MSADVRLHPAYSDGFFDAQEGWPLPVDSAPEYRAGWEAYQRCRQIATDAGLSETGKGQFTAKLTISARGAA
jgi:hypothetical protein